MKLSIIIVNYNAARMLNDAISSIKKTTKKLEYEIIVVDNASQDDSVNMLKSEYPDVLLIENDYNAGFAKANNQGFLISSGQYIMLLNNDTIVLEGALLDLTDFMDSTPEADMVGPRILNENLTLQKTCRRSFPKFFNSMMYFSGMAKLFPESRLFASYLMTYLSDNKNHEVDALSGAAMMIKRDSIIKAGGLLDESYFMHFEDIDLCYRVKKTGGKIYYCHASQIIHLKGQSSKLRSEGVIKNFYDSAFIYFKRNYQHENQVGYFFMVIALTLMKKISFLLLTFKKK